MPDDQPVITQGHELYKPIKCKMTVFGSIEVEGHVTFIKDDFAHFVSDDKKFQILVRRDAIDFGHGAGRWGVTASVAADAHIKALRHRGEPDESWVDIGVLGEGGITLKSEGGIPEGFTPLTYEGKPLRYGGEEPQ